MDDSSTSEKERLGCRKGEFSYYAGLVLYYLKLFNEIVFTLSLM